MRIPARGLIALLAVCMAAHGAGAPPSHPREITVKLGQAVRCGRDVAVCFEGVLEDSRCPVGATCVWVGNARVALTVRRTGQEPVTVELNTFREPRSATAAGCTVELADLAPTRRMGEELDKSTYRVTLKVKCGRS